MATREVGGGGRERTDVDVDSGDEGKRERSPRDRAASASGLRTCRGRRRTPEVLVSEPKESSHLTVLSLSANPAQDWAELRQAALDRLKEDNPALLKRLSALQAFGTHRVPPATDTAGDRSSTMTELVPHASWAAVCQEKAQLEDELR